MGFRVGWCRLLLMIMVTASLVLCSARNINIPLSVSVNEEEWVMEGRSLRVRVNDYSDPSANRGHDPPSTKRPTTTSSARTKSGRRG